MLFRLLFLLTLLGYSTGPDYREEAPAPGGRGFGGVVTVFAALGVLVLLGLVVLAIFILTGHYDSDWLDPVV